MRNNCPFCGSLDIKHTALVGALRVCVCGSCRAKGPEVNPDKFRGVNAQDTDRMRTNEAYRLWNTRHQPKGGEHS